MPLFEKKKALGFKKINGRTLQAYIKGTKLIIEGTCEDNMDLMKLITDLKIDTKGFPCPWTEA